jgi:hypothetical protein
VRTIPYTHWAYFEDRADVGVGFGGSGHERRETLKRSRFAGDSVLPR